jgi:nitrite reductase (NO-forming)
MTLPRALSLLSILLALAVGSCRAQLPAPPAADVEFTLATALRDGRMVFVGVGGEIEGVLNPELSVDAGEIVRVVIVNGDGMAHDFAIPALGVQTGLTTAKGQTTDVVFQAGEAGAFTYFCTVSGHRQAGMAGTVMVRVS